MLLKLNLINKNRGVILKISKVKLHNFRCFGDDDQTIEFDDLTALIGNNSSGKTAALSALNIMFSENSNDRTLRRSDFFVPKDKNPEDVENQDLFIETIFSFEELRENTDEKNFSIPPFFESLVVDCPNGNPYLRIRLEASWEKSNNINGSIESKIFYITCPENVTVSESDRVNANRHDLDRIRLIYIPAVRDPSKQLKNVSGTMMYQIMNSINWSDAIQQNVKDKIQDLNDEFVKENGVTILKDSIHSQWKIYDSDPRYSNAQLRFNSTDMDGIIKKSEVVFTPTVTGKEYSINEMGDGLRSLFYFSMVDSMLNVENIIREEIENDTSTPSFNKKPPILTIIAVEEPENHIAPHLIGKIINKLYDISIKDNSQTILTSHAPAIVKRISPENLRYLRMNNETLSTEIHSIILPDKEKLEDQYKYIKEAVKAYPELYFAKLVILCEGDSEEIILQKFLEISGDGIDESGISIVPLGGRHVNHFWRLLNDLKIPHITLLDLDRERYGGGWGRIKYVLQQLIKIGYSPNEILEVESGVLTDERLENMSNWDVRATECMQSWIEFLENYNVFFSAPLDIDFLMLETYGEEYKSILEDSEGPQLIIKEGDGKKYTKKIVDIEESQSYVAEYESRIERDVRNTLKECGGDGSTYSDEQKKLMVWYNYFFLNRGKPSTHILAFSKIDEFDLFLSTPEVMNKIIETAKKLMKL